MAFFTYGVRRILHEEGVKLRGRQHGTKRQRKKYWKHFYELYLPYRDKLFLEKKGLTFLKWKEKCANEKDERCLKKTGFTFKQLLQRRRSNGNPEARP